MSEFDAPAVYRFITGLSDEVEHHKVEDELERLRTLSLRAAKASDDIVESILGSLRDKLEESALEGSRSLVVFEFRGADTIEDSDGTLSVLFVVKGPRDLPVCFEPVLPRLRKVLKPFDVRHRWDTATNMNSIVVEW